MTKCTVCNCDLGEVPMCFGGASPALSIVPEEEYEARVEENSDQCIVDDEHFFIRGHVELKLTDANDVFIWSVWVSLSEESFQHMSKHWDAEGRENNQPYFGWLMTSLPCYENTLHLKTSVQTQPLGVVPIVTLEPSEHQLSLEQKSGINMQRVHEIVHEVMGH